MTSPMNTTAAPSTMTRVSHPCRPNGSANLRHCGDWRSIVNNGAYLQFLVNWGRDCYVYASQALKKIGTLKMAEIIDECQALVDGHVDCENTSRDELVQLLLNPVIERDGNEIKGRGSSLPEAAVARIYDLSYEFMNYPDNVAALGLHYYEPLAQGERQS